MRQSLRVLFLLSSVLIFTLIFSCDEPVPEPIPEPSTTETPQPDLPPVTGLLAYPSDGRVLLKWTPPQDSRVTGTRLTYSTRGEESGYSGELQPEGTPITGLTNQSPYLFKLVTLDGKGLQSVPAEIESTPVPGPVPLFTASPASYVSGPFLATIEFTRPVSGFTEEDITLTNGTVTDFSSASQNQTLFNITVTPGVPGEVTVSIEAGVCSDSNASLNYACQIPISTRYGEPVSATPDPNIRTLKEGQAVEIPVSELLANDLSESPDPLSLILISGAVGGAAALGMNEGGAVVRFTSTGNAAEEASFLYTVDDGYSTDTAQVTLHIIPFDQPGVIFSNKPSDYINTPFRMEISFTVPINNFTSGDIALTNALLTDFQTLADITSIEVTPQSTGSVTLQVPPDSVFDSYGTGNSASELMSITYGMPVDAEDDSALPELEIRQNSTTVILHSVLTANDISSSPSGLTIVSVDELTGITIDSDLSAGIRITSTPIAGSPAGFSYTVSDGYSTDDAEVTLTILPLAEVDADIFDDPISFSYALGALTAYEPQEIYGDWPRTNGTAYYTNSAEAEVDGFSASWFIGGSSGASVQNWSETPAGGSLLTPYSSEYWEMEASLGSSQKKETRSVGLVLAQTMIDGKPALITATRSLIEGSKWKLSFRHNRVETLLESAPVPGDHSTSDWKGYRSTIRATRRGDLISVITAPVTPGESAPDESTRLSLDLSQISPVDLTAFRGGSPVGYFSAGKKAWFDGISILSVNPDRKIYYVQSDGSCETWVWVKEAGGWGVSNDPNNTIQNNLGVVREVRALPRGYATAPSPLPLYLVYPDKVEKSSP